MYETAVVGSGRKGYEKEELEAYFRRRIKGKLIIFSNIKEKIQLEKEQIMVTCSAETVSYTHLDVYKRQVRRQSFKAEYER